MDEKEKLSSAHTYDNWKAITESDFVTLFIKTWFAFVATLRELYPEHKAYYEATGDSPYVRSYKQRFAEDFHFLCAYSEIEENLYRVYRYGQKMISERYPRFLVDDFYSINVTIQSAVGDGVKRYNNRRFVRLHMLKTARNFRNLQKHRKSNILEPSYDELRWHLWQIRKEKNCLQ